MIKIIIILINIIINDKIWQCLDRAAPWGTSGPNPCHQVFNTSQFWDDKHDQSGDDQQHYRGDDDYESWFTMIMNMNMMFMLLTTIRRYRIPSKPSALPFDDDAMQCNALMWMLIWCCWCWCWCWCWPRSPRYRIPRHPNLLLFHSKPAVKTFRLHSGLGGDISLMEVIYIFISCIYISLRWSIYLYLVYISRGGDIYGDDETIDKWKMILSQVMAEPRLAFVFPQQLL